MTRTIPAPILGISIVILYKKPKDFYKIYQTYADTDKEDILTDIEQTLGWGGMVTLVTDKITGEFKILFWLCDTDNSKVFDLGTVIHESFHIACRIRECMYGFKESLELNKTNEEDWAYLVTETSRVVHNAVMKIQDMVDKKNGKTDI